MKRSDLRLEYSRDTGDRPFKIGNWIQDELSFKYGAWLEEKLLELYQKMEDEDE